MKMSAADISTEQFNMRWSSYHLFVLILFCWSVNLIHLPTANAVLGGEEENALRVFTQEFGLPDWQGDPCVNISWITCSRNPPSANQTVERLNLRQRNLTGVIPKEIVSLSKLQYLDLQENLLSGSIPDLSKMTDLQELWLNANNLTGDIPMALSSLSQLRYLALSDNHLSGSIPDLGLMKDLTELHLHNNQLTGDIHKGLGNLSQLVYMDIRRNQFTGDIPKELGNLSKLSVMSLSENSFSGTIPNLSNMKALKDLWLKANNLSGALPKELGTLSTLEILSVDVNQLTGVLPKELGMLSKLKSMYLSSNQLTGEIPKEFHTMTQLQDLYLSFNNLSGSIPDLSNMKSLIHIDLQSNQLSGIVPDTLATLSNLQTLSLQNNNFSEISDSITTKKDLVVTFDRNVNIIPSNITDENIFGDKNSNTHIVAIIGGVMGVLAIIIFIVLYYLIRKIKYNQFSKEDMPKSARAFTLKQIKKITENNKRVIGRGGFGLVYYGKLDDGKEVAVKVRAVDSKQGAGEFLNEVKLLSRLHHRNLVSLVGYCWKKEQQILVYEYMSQGTLDDHLYSTGLNKSTTLMWKTRLDIAINSARGLEYLHKDCKPPVIHRDIKTSNILLSDKFQAKVGDLGISKQTLEPDLEGGTKMTGITTDVKGTRGYLDPEYFERVKLTTKSDVYSFGMVLLEIITGQKPLCLQYPNSTETNLKNWVREALSNNGVESIVDPTLKEDYNKESMLLMIKLALSCVHPVGVERPDMGDIVHTLIQILQIEEGNITDGYSDLASKIEVPSSYELKCLSDLPMDDQTSSFLSSEVDHKISWDTALR